MKLQPLMVNVRVNILSFHLLMICNAALTLHNITFQAQVMGRARSAIIDGTFPDYLRSFFAAYFGDGGYPEWCVNALRTVGVDLLEDNNAKILKGTGAKWDYADY